MRIGCLEVDDNSLAELCGKWKVSRLEAFGSLLRADFHAGSDIDLLVSFQEEASWSLFQLYEAEQEFAELFGYPVELVPRSGVENSANYIRRKAILESAELLYAA